MTPEQIVAELRRAYYTPTITGIAAPAGLHTATLYRAIHSGRLSTRNAEALEKALRFIASPQSHNRRSVTDYGPLGGH